MNIHLFHDYKNNGWESWGYFTLWKGKCSCGRTIKSTDIKYARGKHPSGKLLLLCILIPSIIFYIFAYLYVSGIYPFNY